MFSLPLALCRQCTLWLPLRCRHARLDREWGPMVSASIRCAALANISKRCSQKAMHVRVPSYRPYWQEMTNRW
ncbi:hypothetical protein BD310DRAFT_810143 [Dichomitus squalens]|uniref:Uncharacterized protein n=1 Tax=Dichomitus squalens TaxID=114155 RepID=A0A4Q9Q676_9APHY|nr:hypothetical protein BD310DRAFT_810143 [Dichomitus squalens]